MDNTSYIFNNAPIDVDAPVRIDRGIMAGSAPTNEKRQQIFIDAECPSMAISWQRYATAVKRIAVGLREHGVRDQDCVALISHNSVYCGSS